MTIPVYKYTVFAPDAFVTVEKKGFSVSLDLVDLDGNQKPSASLLTETRFTHFLRCEAEDWLKENAPNRWDCYHANRKIAFQSEHEAILFKMRWT